MPAPDPPSRTRLTDLAERAGVSTATVSRVLNGKSGVSSHARQAVIAAMELLGYERSEKPHPRSTRLVGLIVPELSNPVFPTYVQVIEAVLTRRGYTPLLCVQQPGGTTEDQYIDILLGQDVAGIIIISGLHTDTESTIDRYLALRVRGLPIVLVNGAAPGIDAPTIAADDTVSVDLAFRHLTSLGHRRIGLAIGPARFIPAQRKRRAFAAALATQGITDDRDHVVSTLFTLEGGATAAHDLLDRGHTAVICGSDLMALGVIRTARSRGMRVPEDLSVIGFDDSVLVGFTDPPLTTVRQPVQAMGRAVVAALLSEIGGTPTTRSELLFHPELIVRDSTGPVPTDH